MVDLKPAPESDRVTTVRRGLNTKKLLLLVLVSMLVHALGLFLFALYKPVEPTVSEKDSLDPIEFAVVPEEPAETAVEDEAENTPPPEPKPQPAPAPPPQTAPEPTPTPQPESVEPPVENQSPVLSGSDEAISEPEPQVTTPTQPPPTPSDSVATNQPPESEPVPLPESESQPANPDGVSTSASDLLGGDYEKTLASSSDTFFSEEALTYKSVLSPKELEAIKDFDAEAYQREFRKKVYSNWNPEFSEKYSVWVAYTIQRSGDVTDIRVVTSSGSQEYDRKAVEALQNLSPAAPLPPEFPLENWQIESQFYLR